MCSDSQFDNYRVNQPNYKGRPYKLYRTTNYWRKWDLYVYSRTQKDCVELDDGGTVFLNEIEEILKSMQMKLLRVIELSSFRRVGGRKDINRHFIGYCYQ